MVIYFNCYRKSHIKYRVQTVEIEQSTMVVLQCIESLILLPTDGDNASLNVKSECQHFIVVTNTGRYQLQFF